MGSGAFADRTEPGQESSDKLLTRYWRYSSVVNPSNGLWNLSSFIKQFEMKSIVAWKEDTHCQKKTFFLRIWLGRDLGLVTHEVFPMCKEKSVLYAFPLYPKPWGSSLLPQEGKIRSCSKTFKNIRGKDTHRGLEKSSWSLSGNLCLSHELTLF